MADELRDAGAPGGEGSPGASRMIGGGTDELFDADALYNEGLAYYRSRRWREAKQCFERVQVLHPGRRGIDTLLREVDMFLQLEAVDESDRRNDLTDMASAAADAPSEWDRRPPRDAEDEGALGVRGWIIALIMLFTFVVIVGGVLLYSLGLPPFSRDTSESSLRNLGQAYIVAQQYEKALEVYDKLLAMVPEDREAINGLENAKEGLYEEARAYEQANNRAEALARYRLVFDADASYKDAGTRIDALVMLDELDTLYAEATEYLAGQAYGEAIKRLLKLRTLDPEYKPGTISDHLYEAYTGQARQLLGLAQTALVAVPDAKPEEPAYAVSDDLLSNLRQAISAYTKAADERAGSEKAASSATMARNLHEGLERYRDWAWNEAIVSLRTLYDDDPAYFEGKAVAVLCDAYLHLGAFYEANEDYQQAVTQFQEMQAVAECDPDLAATRVWGAGIPLTPTATPTNTPLPTATPTNTPRPTLTPVPPTATPTLTPVPTQPPSSGGSSSGGGGGGGGGGSEPKRPTPKPRN